MAICGAVGGFAISSDGYFFKKSDWDIVNASVCPSVPFAIQNHWVEFNQICFMTSSHGKGVREPTDNRQPTIQLNANVEPKPSCYLGLLQD